MFQLLRYIFSFGKLNKSMVPKTSTFESDSFRIFQGEAIVQEAICPCRPGRVKYRGTFWSARCAEKITLAPGRIVRVIDIDEITLLVEPDPEIDAPIN